MYVYPLTYTFNPYIYPNADKGPGLGPQGWATIKRGVSIFQSSVRIPATCSKITIPQKGRGPNDHLGGCVVGETSVPRPPKKNITLQNVGLEIVVLHSDGRKVACWGEKSSQVGNFIREEQNKQLGHAVWKTLGNFLSKQSAKKIPKG